MLFGRSIGTGPATFVAAEYARLGKPIGGLILQRYQARRFSIRSPPSDARNASLRVCVSVWRSPYLSIKSLCRSLVGFLANFVLERFNNREEITHYHGPLLVIHGVQDQLIPCQHGEYLHNTCPSPPELKRLLLAEGADHNVFDDINHVQIPVREFLIDMVEPRLAPTPITFTVPPEPQAVFSCLPSAVSPAASSATPLTTVTPLPLRPLVSCDTRTMPSVAGRRALSSLQRHCATGAPQPGHMRPPASVEYTRVLPA